MTAFYILAPIMVLAALGILFVRKAVHAALLLAVVMISLAILYAALEAPFLFAVQIIVYTGAILMLFLFVLMLVGVDASDSVVETIRGQRLFAILGGLILGVTLVVGVGQISLGTVVGLEEANKDGNIEALANILFSTLRLRLRGHLGAADHRRRGRDGARPPRAAHPEADPGRPAAERVRGVRRDRPAPRPAAAPGRLRPAQRGRHPGAAARRQRRRGLGLPGAGRPRDGPLRTARRRGGAARDRLRPRRPAPRTPGRSLDSTQARLQPGPDTTTEGGVMDSVTPFIVLSAILFTIGSVGVLTRRNAIVVFMCVELMLNASNLALVAFAKQHGDLDGQVAAFFVMVVAAAEVVVGLAIIMTIFRTRRSASVDDASLLKY